MSMFGMCKMAVIKNLVACMTLVSAVALPVSAVELVGKPVPVSGSQLSTSSEASVDAAPTSVEPQVPMTRPPEATMIMPPEPPQAPDEHFDDLSAHVKPFGFDNPPFFRASSVADVIVPIVAIAFVFGGPIFLIIMLVRMHYRDRARRVENINNNIDKLLANGRDIPLELLQGDVVKDYTSLDYLRRALRNLGLGIGMLLFLGILCGFDIGSVGFILIAYGCSQLVVWYLARRDKGVESGL